MNPSTAAPTAERKKTPFLKKLLRVSLGLLACLLLLIGLGFGYEWIADKRAASAYPPPGKLVDAGGHRLHLHIQGTGSPVIVMEAGSGETSLSWRNIPAELSKYATVVSYDRAGYAWSEPAASERTGDNVVNELRTALRAEGLKGPYLLVGHSLGGLYTRLFAEKYPNEVAGLVLIDARPEDDERLTRPILEQEGFQGNPQSGLLTLLKSSGAMRIFKDFLLEGLVPEEDRERFVNVIAKRSFFEAKEKEAALIGSTEDAVRGQRLGSLPVTVIARGLPQNYAQAGLSEQAGRKLEEIWQEGQRSMLKLSQQSRWVVAKQSGHMIIHDEPQLVVDEVLRLLRP